MDNIYRLTTISFKLITPKRSMFVCLDGTVDNISASFHHPCCCCFSPAPLLHALFISNNLAGTHNKKNNF